MARFLVPRLGLAAVIAAATVLIGIALRGPDTNGNVWREVPPGYTRTEVTVVGENGASKTLPVTAASPGPRIALALPDLTFGAAATRMDPGKRVYIQAGCATCHGVDAQGGPVGPPLADSDPKIVTRMIREGRGGMTAYTEAQLNNADVDKMVAYLQGLKTTPKPTTEEMAALARLTYDPAVPTSVLLKGKADLRRSCGGCHSQPNKEEIRGAFASDFDAASLVAEMAQRANVKFEDAMAIAHYMLALRNGADPLKQP